MLPKARWSRAILFGNMVILFTSGGDKKPQSRDIERAIRLLKDWEKGNS
ncbi:hypothetical protein NTG1052_390032 [Candidatus Nitrotoga sp. 1052]|nr:hypothetical protein NTG1052_390032 [Candidatus Nitrotoga sp. 1052]